MSGSRILFVGHEASRTGAPIMLLHLLRWLRAHTNLDFDLLLRMGGPLVEDYGSLCDLLLQPSPHKHLHLATILERRDFGLIYSNTITNYALLSELSSLNCPVLCHAHEVDSFVQFMDPQEAAHIKNTATAFIAVTQEIVRNLVLRGVAREKITMLPGFLPVAASHPPDRERGRSFRRQFQIPEEAILVGGCGSLQWQKGPDLLVHIANLLMRKQGERSIHFVWVGGTANEHGAIQLRWDIASSNLTDHFTLIPSLADTAPFFDGLDIFALSSRNDPLPLVVMEAGIRELPIVCFTGNAEPVDADSGVVVPYLDLDRFAQAIGDLADNATLRASLGKRLAKKIQTNYDISVVAPKVVEIIRKFL